MNKVTKLKSCWLVIPVLLVGLSGCNKTETPVQAQASDPTAVAADSDPAAGNLAPLSDTTQQVAQNNAPDYSSASYDLPAADTQSYPADYAYDTGANQQPIYADDPPPPLPEYNQPPVPGDGYYWTPGYWAFGSASSYYWVPGAWVLAPWVDALWTPPYWDYEGSRYRWHAGYWGPHVGFYGGIDYGYGYTGRGYYGAYWSSGQLRYNREVTNVVPGVVGNVYGYSAPRGTNSRVSYNGGRGGIDVRPTQQEMAVVHDPRTPPLASQVKHAHDASARPDQFASAGRAPAALAVSAPLAATYKAPAARPPAAAMRMAARPAPQQETRPVQQPTQQPAQPAIAQRPGPENRPAPPAALRPEVRQEQRPEIRQQQRPETRQQQRPEPGPAPVAGRPAPQSAAAPRPAAHPVPGPQQRPAPEVRQAHLPPQHPAPAPEVRSAPAPQQQRPAPGPRPAPAVRQAPERPTPQRAEPVARPAPPPHAAPEIRQAPPQQQRPAPVARPAEPPARPAPPVKPEEDKKKG